VSRFTLTQKQAPACDGGRQNHPRGLYHASDGGSTAVARWFHAHRQSCACRLWEAIQWHGGKIFLDDRTYRSLAGEGLDRVAVDRAADDLFYLRKIDLSLIGDMPVLRLIGVGYDVHSISN